MVAILGVVSAVLFGASDFFGGLASRRLPSILVAAIANLVAAVVVGAVVAVSAPVWSADALIWGSIAGVGGGLATAGFYAVLAVGPMSVISPTVAVLYALIPAAVGIGLGERLAPLGYAALGVVFVAGVLLAMTPGSGGARMRPGVLALALLTGVGFSVYIIAIDRAPADAGMIPLLVELIAGVIVFAPIIAVRAARSRGSLFTGLRERRTVAQAVLCGLLIGIGTMLLLVGLQLGDLAVMSVLNSLYPLGTVALAVVILRERMTRLQLVGLVLAAAGSVVLGLAT